MATALITGASQGIGACIAERLEKMVTISLSTTIQATGTRQTLKKSLKLAVLMA